MSKKAKRLFVERLHKDGCLTCQPFFKVDKKNNLMKINCSIYSAMEDKANGSVDTKSPAENGQLPDPANWAVADVVNYFKATGFEEQATAFQDQEIDGKSLLLMTRNDVLTGLSIKLGPALKIYEYHVKPLQTQHLKSNAC
ncbi:sterile alpha motif domain-containing protein 13 isoform X1 [Syngnathoides biaculeatus]|uniref:sterile alpha motif domain-containing protein 13 isoform X1 n=2 Tax=Syngnathoides biaculeatus TaxID=300417 RepID=UPI002ADD8D7B|nr:sterile alpha motif domain-containing protein 13 isoform X1 [Syngnathoides biaculeatus]